MYEPRDAQILPSSHAFRPEQASGTHRWLAQLLEAADIQVNGGRPWDIQLHRKGVLERAYAEGNLGLGESYAEGAWDCDALDGFFYRLIHARLDRLPRPVTALKHAMAARLINRQTRSRAWAVGRAHYDLGNAFYEAMLDPRMTYTCGYWKSATTLTQAQEAKLDLVCKKLNLERGMRVLDIGCGWGSFMAYAVERYGVHCTGISISAEQIAWARDRYRDPHLDFRLEDYRAVNEPFDRIVSLGMFEHVGRKNHRAFMRVVERCLTSDGLALLHTIGKNRRHSTPDPWIDKYIFPNGDLPSLGQIADAADDLFVIEDVHNFGADYERTLLAWHANFEAAWPSMASAFDPVFYRRWRYYLLSCAGAFRARDLQLWQVVLSKTGVLGGYHFRY